nr:MAG TPA: hypothetical protein [Caudoviricetes sp.]
MTYTGFPKYRSVVRYSVPRYMGVPDSYSQGPQKSFSFKKSGCLILTA